MKIVLDASPLAQTEKTGVSYFIHFFAEALLQVASGHQVVTWAPDMERDPFPGYGNHEFQGRRLFSRGALEMMWGRYAIGAIAGDADIYHVPCVAFPAPRRNPRTKVVVTVYDLAFALHPETVSGTDYFRYLADRLPAQLAQADGVVAISQSTSHDLQRILGVPAEKIIVTYPATELTAPGPQPPTGDEAAFLAGLPQRYILCLGTWEPRKNITTLFHAMSRLKDELEARDVVLCMAGGKGWKYHEAEQLLRDLGLAQRIRTLGYVPRAWLPRLYAGAQMFVYPSLYEGFGMPVLEAMACGAPVITSNVSSLPEAAGDAGLLVDPLNVDELAAAILRLLDDTELRESLRVRGFAHASRFSWQGMARETLTFYQKLVQAS